MHQVVQHRCARGWIGAVEAARVGERVEQEMRLDLCLQHLQPGLRHLPFERLAVHERLLRRRYARDLTLVEFQGHGE